MTARAITAIVSLAVAGCSGDSQDLAWQIEFETEALATQAVAVRAEVRAEGCSGSAVEWSTLVRRGSMRMSVPALGPGIYGFAATATDDQCRVIARGCTELRLPTERGSVTTLLEGVPPEPQCGADECASGVCGRDAGPPDAGPTPTEDAGPIDAGPSVDAGRPVDAGALDAGPTAVDAGPPDGGPPDAGPPDAGPPLDRVIAVEGYLAHACALYSTGRVMCWGLNDRGQLGDGTNVTRFMPVSVMGLFGVQALARGSTARHTCAVLRGGAVMCWGNNERGQLGDGGGADRSRPVLMRGISGAVAVGVGEAHTCVLTAGGEVHCMGENADGQVGDGTTIDRDTPVRVTLTRPATAIATGQAFSCAMDAVGVSCWGSNDFGMLGSGGTSARRLTPGAVMGASGAVSLAAGSEHGCISVAGGDALCWGNNEARQLGDGSAMPERTSATPVVAVTDPIDGISGGGWNDTTVAFDAAHTCMRRAADRTLRCWGSNDRGQLGDGTTTDATMGREPTGLGAVDHFTTGARFTCAVASGGAVSCWGSNTLGQLGDGTTTDRRLPTPVRGL